MVSLDESAVNERTLDRKYGWTPVGLEASVTSPFHFFIDLQDGLSYLHIQRKDTLILKSIRGHIIPNGFMSLCALKSF